MQRSARGRFASRDQPGQPKHVARRTTDPTVAVAYVRASTSSQTLTLDAQRERMEAWAAAAGVTIASVHVDAGVSGTAPLSKRPGLSDALVALEDVRAGVLVVTDRSRLARTALDAALLDREVERLGSRVHCVDRGDIDADGSAEGRFVRQVLDAVNELEVARTRARTAAILRHKRAQGLRTGGRVPYGYQANGDRLVPHSAEQAAVKRIDELHRAGVSQRRIAQQLADEGHPPRGNRWHATTVARLINREAIG